MQYSRYSLHLFVFFYGTITLSGILFQETSNQQTQVLMRVLQHHISLAFLQGIQFAHCCFQSLLLAASQLISFPAGTKTFQFPAFPVLVGLEE